ncbi:YfiH family protein [Bradyrhizobium diazoefficiens]
MTEQPLLNEIKALIKSSGPMPVWRYMELCLMHPRYGYYVSRDPLGREGDFTTAPEVSQMFGELLGLWTASVWKQMGSPQSLRLIELGPGRGTMMADALRALRVLPPLYQALQIHLVEVNPVLRERQSATLSGARNVAWHDSIDDVPEGPSIILANEYFDVLPIHQMVKRENGWHERVIEIDPNGKLQFGAASEPTPRFDVLLPPLVRAAPVGAVFEWRPDGEVMKLATRVRDQDGAALIIDYGHLRSDAGDTFQAIARHTFTDPLKAPGQADVTAHVDFQALARAAEDVGARVHGPVTQGDFLKRVGIDTRAAALMQKATPEVATDISVALKRLTDTRAQRHGLDVQGARHLRAAANWPCRPQRSRTRRRELMTLASSLLSAVPGLRHSFFTREGGVSGGIYSALNGGLGSNDDQALVAENRRRMAEHVGVAPERFLSLHQIHSPDVLIAETPWPSGPRPKGDALVTKTPGIALGVSTADCGPVLFVDPSARVIGGAHAGWKGALTGVLESTILAMEKLGATRGGIIAAIGPLIRQESYEVGNEFVARFIEADADNAMFFIPSVREGHAMFDLAGFIRTRLEAAGILMIDDLGLDTYADERFFSYRRSVHRKEPDYGRHVHAIALEG